MTRLGQHTKTIQSFVHLSLATSKILKFFYKKLFINYFFHFQYISLVSSDRSETFWISLNLSTLHGMVHES